MKHSDIAPSGIEEAVCADIAARQLLGIAKYGTTVADNPLPLRDWLQHAYEESLDLSICIKTSPGVTRVTNRHSEWTHVPSAEQSYEERLLSWMVRPYEHDADRSVSEDTGLAIDGIMALLPVDSVDWTYGPWPDTLEDALRFLTDDLTALAAKRS